MKRQNTAVSFLSVDRRGVKKAGRRNWGTFHGTNASDLETKIQHEKCASHGNLTLFITSQVDTGWWVAHANGTECTQRADGAVAGGHVQHICQRGQPYPGTNTAANTCMIHQSIKKNLHRSIPGPPRCHIWQKLFAAFTPKIRVETRSDRPVRVRVMKTLHVDARTTPKRDVVLGRKQNPPFELQQLKLCIIRRFEYCTFHSASLGHATRYEP